MLKIGVEMTKLSSLPNIGKEMELKLNSIGIFSAEELQVAGSKNAFIKLKMKFDTICLVHLYCLQGAVDCEKYDRLSPEVKKELKEFADTLK